LLRVGVTASIVAIIGVIVPLFLGWGLFRLYGYKQVESIFVGAALVATSVGITAQVLSAKGVLSHRTSQIILAAAVIDDVLGLVVLAAVSSMAKDTFQWMEIALTAVMPIVFTIVLAYWGTHPVRKTVPRIQAQLRAS